MSKLILETLTHARGLIPMALKPAITGHVTAAQRNFAEITGRGRNRNYFYREAEVGDARQGLFPRTSDFYFSFALADRIAGDVIEQEIESWFALRRQLQGDGVLSVGTLWEAQESVDALLNALRSAIVSGNRIETRFVLIQIRRNVDAMLALCNSAMPEFSIGAFK